MLQIVLKKLNEGKSDQLEMIVHDMKVRMQECIKNVSTLNLFIVFLLAYLASENQIKDAIGLYLFVNRKMPKEQKHIIMENINSFWPMAIELANTYTKGSLKAAVFYIPVLPDIHYKENGMLENIRKLSAKI